MTKPVCMFLICLIASAGYAYGNIKDSLLTALKDHPADTTRVIILSKLARIYLYEKPIVGVDYALEGLKLSRSLKYDRGVVISLNALGNCYRMTGNYAKGLDAHFKALKMSEDIGHNDLLAGSYHGISVIHEDQGNYVESLKYAHLVIRYARAGNSDDMLMRIQSNMGRSFKELNMLDSALHYTQNAYEIALSRKDLSMAGNILGRLGETYYKMGNNEMASLYYTMGVDVAKKFNDNNSLEELYYSMSNFYLNNNRPDSALYYARKSLSTAELMSNPVPIIRGSLLLSEYFTTKGRIDSAFKYQGLAMRTKDTLFTEQKIKEQQMLTIDEQERIKEKADAEQSLRKEKKRELEYMVVAIALISIIVVFLLLSGSIVVKSGTIVYFGTVALLLTFEFINLIIHPLLDRVTDHSPSLMLIALTVVAAILVPIHHRIQSWIRNQLVEKNRKIRLAAAKKTIAELEPGI
jgi:tetratricopeptide (TPR) repeat protein